MIHIGAFWILLHLYVPTIQSCCLSHVERLGNGAYSPHWSHRVARHPTPSLVFTCKYYHCVPPEFAKEVFDCLPNLLPTITPWSRLHARDVNSAALFKTGASRCRYHCSAVGGFLGITIKKTHAWSCFSNCTQFDTKYQNNQNDKLRYFDNHASIYTCTPSLVYTEAEGLVGIGLLKICN